MLNCVVLASNVIIVRLLVILLVVLIVVLLVVLIEECVRSLAKIHNMKYREVKRMLIRSVVKRWGLDENQLGAFVLFNPLQVT